MQGHSTASTLPPLPEGGPTEETKVQEVGAKGGDESPLPSASTSPVAAAVEEEEGDEAQTEVPPVLELEVQDPPPKRRRLVKKVPSSVSSPAKGLDLGDEGDSVSSPSTKDVPLDVSLLSSAPPPKSGEALLFGGPNFEDLDSEEEDRFAPLLF